MKKDVKEACLAGKRVYLRPLCRKDINKKYLSWLKDKEVTKYMEIRNLPDTLKDLEVYYKNIVKSRADMIFAIVTKRKNLHIGNIKIGGINWFHRYGNVGIMIGEKKYWGKGYGTQACRLLLGYVFNRLNLNKVTLGIYGTHKSAIAAYRKAGFKVEGKIKNLLNFRGKYTDKIIMGISKSEFNKLRESSDI